MTKIQVRRGSAVAWSAANPVLAAGEPGFDETAKRMKVGDGRHLSQRTGSLQRDGSAASRSDLA